jgi:hypothetical protein
MQLFMLLLQFLTIAFTNSFIKIPFQKKQYYLCECKFNSNFNKNHTLYNKKCIHVDIPTDDEPTDEKWEDGEIPWEFNDTQRTSNDTNKNPILDGHNIAFLFI